MHALRGDVGERQRGADKPRWVWRQSERERERVGWMQGEGGKESQHCG